MELAQNPNNRKYDVRNSSLNDSRSVTCGCMCVLLCVWMGSH